MPHFLLGLLLGALIAASIVAPMLAPWPIRVRYLATAQTIDPLLGLGPALRIATRAVTLHAVEVAGDHVELVIADVGFEVRSDSVARPTRLRLATSAPSVVAELDGWAALHTPLLMITDENHSVQLYAPGGVVTDLAVVAQEPVR